MVPKYLDGILISENPKMDNWIEKGNWGLLEVLAISLVIVGDF